MEVVNGELMVFGGVGGQDSLEILEAEEWRLEALEGKHIYHASVTIPCEQLHNMYYNKKYMK